MRVTQRVQVVSRRREHAATAMLKKRVAAVVRCVNRVIRTRPVKSKCVHRHQPVVLRIVRGVAIAKENVWRALPAQQNVAVAAVNAPSVRPGSAKQERASSCATVRPALVVVLELQLILAFLSKKVVVNRTRYVEKAVTAVAVAQEVRPVRWGSVLTRPAAQTARMAVVTALPVKPAIPTHCAAVLPTPACPVGLDCLAAMLECVKPTLHLFGIL